MEHTCSETGRTPATVARPAATAACASSFAALTRAFFSWGATHGSRGGVNHYEEG